VKTQLGIPRVPYVDYNIQIVDIDKTYQNDVTLIPTTNGDFNNIDDLIQWYYYNIDNRIDIYIHKLISDTIIFFIEQLIFSAFQNIDKVINPIPLRRGSNPLGNSSQITQFDLFKKYLKYKQKYLELKKLLGSMNIKN
jgi:hypothetical protein